MNLKSIPILYEDKDVLVINKPAGLVVHSDGRTKEPTLVEWILKKYPKIKGVGDPLDAEHATVDANLRPGIVHRLDRETSGALIIAKNQEAFYFLKHQFKKQEVHKTYHAFVYGKVKNDDGLIDRPIARSRTNPVLWSATRGRKGEDREAITEYRVLQRGGDYSFLELYPRTGRTHQLRVHLKAINYPIVADKLYSKNEPALGFKRLALHSRQISFLLPDGKRMRVEAPYPADFLAAKKPLEKANTQTPKTKQ
ncbi:MAG: Pseudouridine synthase, RluA family [Parcubacteria group bacterium GW2011_GWA2_49_9]|nr:MAG: Pseudouridine synthase, RluA family [Parcubacteria group bacterium GW2011_GWA2_49_9]